MANTTPPPPEGSKNLRRLERVGNTLGILRMWFLKSWKIGLLMAKGGYLLAERRRLFVKLGEEVYDRILKGELKHGELEPLVRQLEKLTKKVEIEEVLIHSVRYGTRPSRHRDGGNNTESVKNVSVD